MRYSSLFLMFWSAKKLMVMMSLIVACHPILRKSLSNNQIKVTREILNNQLMRINQKMKPKQPIRATFNAQSVRNICPIVRTYGYISEHIRKKSNMNVQSKDAEGNLNHTATGKTTCADTPNQGNYWLLNNIQKVVVSSLPQEPLQKE